VNNLYYTKLYQVQTWKSDRVDWIWTICTDTPLSWCIWYGPNLQQNGCFGKV